MVKYHYELARMPLLTLVVVLICLVVSGEAVKHESFRKCVQSGFCRRNRAFADRASDASWQSPYNLDPDTVRLEDGQLKGTLWKSLRTGVNVELPFLVHFFESGATRVVIDEAKRMAEDIELPNDKVNKKRYSEAERWTIVGALEVSKSAFIVPGTNSESTEAASTRVLFGKKRQFEAIIQHSPLKIELQINGETHVELNSGGLLNVEHWRTRAAVSEDAEDDQSTWWEESFDGHTDSKPRGPESVAIDASFRGYTHLFGIPEHADDFLLKQTRGGPGNHQEPYRLFNTDVFEYELNSPMSLYGSIPLLQAHRPGSTVGLFWLNTAETWVDIVQSNRTMPPYAQDFFWANSPTETKTQTHWMSESGRIDFFVLFGSTPQDINKLYGQLTGYPQLPPHFSIGYHQCRWNYVSDEDVKDVNANFDKYQIPYDAIWLDIEYTDDRKYFTWDPLSFEDPEGMQDVLAEAKRNLVVLIDPHIKKAPDSYFVSQELRSQDLAVLNKNGEIYESFCWPGISNWIDAFNPATQVWWSSLHQYDRYKGSRPNLYIENDMNEPSVFGGPEATMPRDNIHFGQWEHRDVHNLNGLTFVNATFQALLDRDNRKRPFILTRSFFAGSQRMTAMWTGDNQASWEHLKMSLPMILSNGVAGFPFAGADVGGFFKDPAEDLLTRWYQAGIWYPFFRAHSHIDTRRREPYLIREPFRTIIIQAIRLRYQLLPLWYTAFQEASVSGSPIIKPQYYAFPNDERGFAIDSQFWLGSTGILIRPVVAKTDVTDVYLADEERYYDFFDFTIYHGSGLHSVPAPLDKIPVFVRGGHIFPRRERIRRSSSTMRFDPFSLTIALNGTGAAEGSLYLDDGESFDYQEGACINRRFVFQESTLSSLTLATKGPKTAQYLKTMQNITVNKITVIDPPASWRERSWVKVFHETGKPSFSPLVFHEQESPRAAYAVVKNPGLEISQSWTIEF